MKHQDRDATHLNGKPTPKWAHCQTDKKAASQKAEARKVNLVGSTRPDRP